MNDIERKALEQDIAALAGGESEAIDRHLDLLSESDEARDLRHDCREIAASIEELAQQYEHPDDFCERIEALIDEGEADEGETSTPAASKKTIPRPGKASSLPRALWALSAVAAAGLMLIGVQSMSGSGEPEGKKTDSGTATARDALSATLTAFERSANDGASGIHLVSTEGQLMRPLGIGEEIPTGAILRTDARTRARLALSDGSELSLATNTEIQFDSGKARSLHLREGELVTNVAHLEEGPSANYYLPRGRVEVLGTKFALTADRDYNSVRVLRGRVALHSLNKSGERVFINPGEEATVATDGTLELSASLDRGEALRWSEIDGELPDDEGMSGIGELRAYKPGDKRDRDWPIALESHVVRVKLVGNIARTEVEEVFRNDSNTELEGIYRFPLPSGAKIDELSLDVEGRFERGAIVDKERAGKIWKGVIANAEPKSRPRPQEIIWVPGPWKDPALLEQEEGNQFKLRIFPIPAKSSRTVRLAYNQTIAPRGARRRYVYPLPRSADGSTVAESFRFDMDLSGITEAPLRSPGYEMQHSGDSDRPHLHLEHKAFVPNGDIVVDYQPNGADAELKAWAYGGPAPLAPELKARKGRGKRHTRPEVLAEQEAIAADDRQYALMALRPTLPRWTEERSQDHILVVDSSQSMTGDRFTRSLKTAAAFVQGMDRRDRFALMLCDIRCETFGKGFERPGVETLRRLKSWFEDKEAAGASFLENSLEQAAALARQSEAERDPAILYIGDGVATMGHRSATVLRDTAKRLREDKGISLHTVSSSADSDESMLAELARVGGGHFVAHDSQRRPFELADAMLESRMGVSLQDPELTLPAGLEEHSADGLATLRAGDELLITARYRHDIDGHITLRGTVGGKPYENRFPIHLAANSSANNSFVPRMWASQRIEALQRTPSVETRDRIVALSKSYGVMSKETSLLVLESEAMFKAFGIDRSQHLATWSGDEDEELAYQGDGLTGYGSMLGEAGEMAGLMGAGSMGGSFNGKGGSGKSASLSSRSSATRKDTKAKKRAPRPMPSTDSPFADDSGAAFDPPPPPPMDRNRGRGQWMRRIWEREGSIHTASNTPGQQLQRLIDQAESELQQAPDSRQAHRKLVELLSRSGDMQRADEVAHSWYERDRLDTEVLTHLASIRARLGDREGSLRLLSGLADLDPGDHRIHLRLARAYQRLEDRSRECAHRVVLAELAPQNLRRQADAQRCERANGRRRQGEMLTSTLSDKDRQRVAKLSERIPAAERIRGDLQIDASWQGNSDLDISIIGPRGERLSWQGGHKRIAARGVQRIGREELSLARVRKGDYRIEISRTNPDDHSRIQGRIELRLLGQRRSLPFELTGASQEAALLKVRMRSRMVPL